MLLWAICIFVYDARFSLGFCANRRIFEGITIKVVNALVIIIFAAFTYFILDVLILLSCCCLVLHLLFKLFEVLSTLLFSCFFAQFSTFDIDTEIVTQVVSEFKLRISSLIALRAATISLSFSILPLLYVVLQVPKAEVALTKLDMLHQSLS